MPRGTRRKSRTEIYHVMLRGINRQNIFEEDSDCIRFLEILSACKDASGFKLYAFCLMTNHIHLLVECCGEPIDMIIKRLGSRYVYWYNDKYQRTGHLFQDRYKSEVVENQQYFLTVLRYIIQNPMKAGLEKVPGTYRWNSFQAYEKGKGSITDTAYAIDIVGSRDTLISFLTEENNDVALDLTEQNLHISDDAARTIIQETAHCNSIAEYQSLSLSEQRRVVETLYVKGASPLQIIRLTGKAKATVYRIINEI